MTGEHQKDNNKIVTGYISTRNIPTTINNNNNNQVKNCFTLYLQYTSTATVKIVGTDGNGKEHQHNIPGDSTDETDEQWKQIKINLTGKKFKKVRDGWIR